MPYSLFFCTENPLIGCRITPSLPPWLQMSRQYKVMPPLWRLEELLVLTDRYPSGLEWRVKKACNAAGTQAGRRNKVTGFYMIYIDNVVYLAHRIVYYLRTGEDPKLMDIVHESENADKDNRKTLIASKKYDKKIKLNSEELSHSV
jgi:hypothetical protein